MVDCRFYYFGTFVLFVNYIGSGFLTLRRIVDTGCHVQSAMLVGVTLHPSNKELPMTIAALELEQLCTAY